MGIGGRKPFGSRPSRGVFRARARAGATGNPHQAKGTYPWVRGKEGCWPGFPKP